MKKFDFESRKITSGSYRNLKNDFKYNGLMVKIILNSRIKCCILLLVSFLISVKSQFFQAWIDIASKMFQNQCQLDHRAFSTPFFGVVQILEKSKLWLWTVLTLYTATVQKYVLQIWKANPFFSNWFRSRKVFFG